MKISNAPRLRQGLGHLAHEGAGRLPVISRENRREIIGMLSRSDILSAHKRRLEEHRVSEKTISLHII